jgi:hypothetical protein
MWPSMSAQDDGQTLKVYAALLSGSDFVVLDTGDYFTATVGNDTVVLTREPYEDGKVHYFATFPSSQEAQQVTIAFARTEGRIAAPKSTTVVAAPFEITTPSPPTVKRGDVISLAISPAPSVSTSNLERMTIAVSGDCLEDHDPYPALFDAQGKTSFDTSPLVLKKGATAGCDIGIQVRHEYTGKSDSAFSGAVGNPVEGLQARYITTALVL